MVWWWQKITAVYVAVFTIPLIVTLRGLGAGDYEWLFKCLSSPLGKSLGIAFIVSVVTHGYIGIRIVIEDYVPIQLIRFPLIALLNLIVAVMSLWGVFIIIKI